MVNLYDYDRQQLENLLAKWGYSTYHAGILWQNLYRKYEQSFSQMVNLRSDLLSHLKNQTRLPQPAVKITLDSQDGQTRKFLLWLEDGQTIETVQMQYHDRFTACISTQVGCAMGCVFCATGQMGYTRHLSAGEIVSQVLFVNRQLAAANDKIRNIVFMGMGEPLHNFDNTLTAIDILIDAKGLAIAPSKITLSTVGLPDAIRRLADAGRKINLAVSLHAATDAERMALVPIAAKWNLQALMAACRHYTVKTGRRIFFEWALIAGKNDTPLQAHAVGNLLKGMEAHLNVIPLNPTAAYDGQAANAGNIANFLQIVKQYGIPTTIRQRRGIDIAAGCGQLRSIGDQIIE